MATEKYILKKSIEYGGQIIRELLLDDDVSPVQIRDIDLAEITKASEMSKAAAALTKQPLELIESLKLPDWLYIANRAANCLGNAATPTA